MKPPVDTILVGAGFVGKFHLQAARDSIDLRYVAFVDSEPAVVAQVSRDFGVRGYLTLDEALRSHRAEAVDLCIPTHLHCAAIRDAAERGLHILCEKPLALSMAQVREILEVLGRTGVSLMVAEVIRFWPEFKAAVDFVRSNELGQLKRVELLRLATAPPYNQWMVEEELGGGAVIDLQIHDFSFLIQILGAPLAIEPAGVRQSTVNDVSNILDFGPSLSVSNRASFGMPSSYIFRSAFLLEFEGGVADLDDWRREGEKLLVFPNDGERQARVANQSNPFREELEYFAQQVRTGEPFDLVPIEESILSLRMCLASREALRRNARVEMSDPMIP